jgi:hypothetical protein
MLPTKVYNLVTKPVFTDMIVLEKTEHTRLSLNRTVASFISRFVDSDDLFDRVAQLPHPHGISLNRICENCASTEHYWY